SCGADVGVTRVDFSDFDDGSGVCDPDGWSLVPAAPNACRTNIDVCGPGSPPTRACCDDFATICETTTFGSPVLVTNKITNCTSGERQWRLFKTFNLSGLTDNWVCFDRAEDLAGNNSGLLISAEDASNGPDWLECRLGGTFGGLDGFFYRHCVNLPGWADDNSAVTLTFVMQSDADTESVFLDNIEVKGWSGGCAADTVTLLDDNFGGMTCDTSNWTFSGGSNTCDFTGCTNNAAWQPGLFGEGTAFTMETSLDASSADGELTVCFRIGGAASQASDSITLQYDSGSGYVAAWTQTGSIGTLDECREVCVDLSNLDPAVNNNANLGIRFDIESTQTVGLYGVIVSGARYCTADPTVLTLSSLTSAGGGNYDFSATDEAAGQLTAQIKCQWDPQAALNDQQSIWFQP
ncbi:MAG: hypothetical protein JRJ87_23910, partial [Deltaproteobacteria bacterium]|nr:hypothetical protein [Deltaproteobacteria bacterium]